MLRYIGLSSSRSCPTSHLGLGCLLGMAANGTHHRFGPGLLASLLVRDHSLEVHELGALKALADGPLEDVAIHRDGDEVLRPALAQRVFLYDPVDLPHCTGVLVQSISSRACRCENCSKWL